MSGTKYDQEKVRFDLLPMDALYAIAYVMTMAVPGAKDKNGNDVLCGAQKYGDRNWEQGMDPQRVRGAQMRHDCSNQLGETRDESGHLHLAHKACDAIMELTYALRGITADESTWPAKRPSKCMNEAKQGRQTFAAEAKTSGYERPPTDLELDADGRYSTESTSSDPESPRKYLEALQSQLCEFRQSRRNQVWTDSDNIHEEGILDAIMWEEEILLALAAKGQGLPPL